MTKYNDFVNSGINIAMKRAFEKMLRNFQIYSDDAGVSTKKDNRCKIPEYDALGASSVL